MSPLRQTLKHILVALVIVACFGLLIAPSSLPAFDVQWLTSLIYPRQSRTTTGVPVQVRGIACHSVLANPLLQRPGRQHDASISVPDPPDRPFGLLQLAAGINPVVEYVLCLCYHDRRLNCATSKHRCNSWTRRTSRGDLES
jgi:hypothetical protein